MPRGPANGVQFIHPFESFRSRTAEDSFRAGTTPCFKASIQLPDSHCITFDQWRQRSGLPLDGKWQGGDCWRALLPRRCSVADEVLTRLKLAFSLFQL